MKKLFENDTDENADADAEADAEAEASAEWDKKELDLDGVGGGLGTLSKVEMNCVQNVKNQKPIKMSSSWNSFRGIF